MSFSDDNQLNVDVDVMGVDERRQSADPDLFFKDAFDHAPVHLKPGEVRYSNSGSEMIVAMVGRGVFVSIYDIDLHMGAVAYVLLSDSILQAFPHFDDVDASEMDKAFAPIGDCLGEMKRNGAGKKRIRVCMVGGADVVGDEQDSGTKNYVFVREALKRKGLSIFQEDLGGTLMRRVHFFSDSGKVVKKMLRRESDVEIITAMERDFQKNNTSGA